MKAYFIAGGRTYAAKPPHHGASYADVTGWKCECGYSQVSGTGAMCRGHDAYEAVARCVGCGEDVGELRAVMDTLFGLEEDELVLHGRCRVY